MQPIIILHTPQLGENIGMAARAMLNFGLSRLRLVNPRDGWPSDRAGAASSGADAVLADAEVFPDLVSATADCHLVLATSARPHDVVKTVYTPDVAAHNARAAIANGQHVAFVFGCERTGLHNDDLSRCDAVIRIPTNPDFSSLNVAQAVILISYQYMMSGDTTPDVELDYGRSRPANKDELNNFFHRLELALEESGFYTNEQQKPTMQQNLRAAFMRGQLSEQEIRTLHGVLAALMAPHGRRRS